MPLPIDTEYKEYFYRYRHFDDENCIKSLELLLLKNEMYLTSPLSFNDPYDCRPHFIAEGTEREKRAYFKRATRAANPTMTKNEVNALATKCLKQSKNCGYDFATKVTEVYYSRIVPSAGMICLSKVPDNILMWSHYASSHSGICLQFEGNVDIKSIFQVAYDVKYTDEYPVIDFTTDPKDWLLEKGLLTKAKDWEYEREYRIICDANLKKIKFPPESLTGIIFGLKTSTEHRKLVTDWMHSRKIKPILYESRMKKRQFGVDIVRFENK
jgi:hypothetical protein